MDALNAIICPRESEFTGLKGQVLRYVGAAFFLTVFGLFAVAAGNRHEGIVFIMDPLSDLLFACAVALYPLVTCWRHLAKMTAAYRAELDASEAAAEFSERCRALLARGPVTLLYAARDERCNHALVLAGWLRERLMA